ncbi:MAG: DUF3971 domain-containing protein [Reyranellaceae bacterium]
MAVRILAATVLSAIALVVVVAIRLMAGPIDLDFLKHRIAEAADVPGNEFKPDADRIFVEWGGLSQPVRLVFDGVRITNLQDRVVATVPRLALSFAPRDVVSGRFLPTSVVVERPSIEAEITREGGMLQRVFARSDADSQNEVVELLFEQLLAKPNYHSLLGQLDTVSVEQARLTLRDERTGIEWVAPAARAQLTRGAAGVIISASAHFSPDGGRPVSISVSGIYARDRSRVSAMALVSDVRPSLFADLSPDVALLRGVDLALTGQLQIEADGHGDIRSVVVEVTGGNGTVTLPGVLPVTHRVKSINARATVDAIRHTAQIERIALDFGAAKIMVAGAGRKTAEGQSFSGRAEVMHIPVGRLGDYWPLEFAPGGRAWANANLSSGEINVAAEFGLSTPDHDLARLKVDRMVGLIDYRGMSVRYMPHMPELEGVSGTARYEDGTLRFDVANGTAVGLRTAGTTIVLTGLAGPEPHYATIRMPITGSAPDVIRFLARPKLGLPKDVLYDYRRVGGDVTVDLSLAFPLLNALTVNELDIKAEAALSKFSLRDAIGDVDLGEATARVKYGNSELNISGTGKLGGSPVEIGWRSLFGAKVPFRQRYELKGTIPAALVAKAGFPSPEPWVKGPIATTLSYQVAPNGAGEVVGRFELRGAHVSAPPLGWAKEPGIDGQVLLTLRLAPGGKVQTIDYDARSNGLLAIGQARFAGDNALQQVVLQQFKIGRTDIAGDWRIGPGGTEVTLRGSSLELPRVRHALKARHEYAVNDPTGTAAASHAHTRLTLQLQQVLTELGTLGYANGRLELAGENIVSADITIGGGKGSTFRVTPGAPGRSLFLYVADFGAMLRDAGWIDGLVDGYLHIEGRFRDYSPTAVFDGKLKMGPYRLQRVAPRGNIGTLNAAIDGLNRAGNGLQQFDSLEASVSKFGDRIQIKNGHTSGQSIGLTTQGHVDLGSDTAQLAGIVVPAFALNNLLSNVPLLGPLLTGGKDGGLFAVSYQLYGPFANLKTDVNMMSAMTPGGLRDLFNAQPDAVQPPLPPEIRRAP